MCKACAAKTYKLATDLSVCLACAAPNVVNAGKTDCGEKAEEEDKTSIYVRGGPPRTRPHRHHCFGPGRGFSLSFLELEFALAFTFY